MPFFLSSQGVILWSWKFAFKIRWRNFFWAGLYAQGFYCDLNCWTGSSWIDPNYFQKNPAVKVKKNQEDTLHLILSPPASVKIQNMGGKICLRCKGKTLLGIVNKLFIFKSFLTKPSNVLKIKSLGNAQQCFAFTPQANFPAHILNFHWR